MDFKSNRSDTINHVMECINAVHKIFDYYVDCINHDKTLNDYNTNNNDSSLDFDKHLSNTINLLDNHVTELTDSNSVTKNKHDFDKLKPERLKTNNMKKEKDNKDRIELQLNYLKYLKEYYVCYLKHFVTVYSNYYINNNEVNNKLIELFGFMKKLSLFHIKLVLESLPRVVNYNQTYFETFRSINLIYIPCSYNKNNSNNTTGSNNNRDNTSTNRNYNMDNKLDFKENLLEEFVKYLNDNGYDRYAMRLNHLIRPKVSQENQTFVAGQQYQQNFISNNNFDFNKMNEKVEVKQQNK